jgi:hypothetical protein
MKVLAVALDEAISLWQLEMSIGWKRVGRPIAFNRGARIPIGLEGILLATLGAVVGEEKPKQGSRQNDEDAANSQSGDECDSATIQLDGRLRFALLGQADKGLDMMA